LVKIILDTDFLLSAIKFKVNIFSELKRICDFPYNLWILDKTLDELEGKKEGKLVKNLIKDKVKVKETNKDKSVDDLLMGLKEKFILATQDKELKKRAKKKNLKLITIRQKKYLKIN
jgi:rRNA-processing protein FCF1